jgi:hypothetical protein
MKTRTLIIFFILSVNNFAFSQADRDSANPLIQEVNIECCNFDPKNPNVYRIPELGVGVSTYVIVLSEKEFKKLCSCPLSIEIDFDKYTLFEMSINVGGCKEPDYEYNFYKEDGNYFMAINIIKYGLCRLPRYIKKWFLIQKLEENKDILFSISVEQRDSNKLKFND